MRDRASFGRNTDEVSKGQKRVSGDVTKAFYVCAAWEIQEENKNLEMTYCTLRSHQFKICAIGAVI